MYKSVSLCIRTLRYMAALATAILTLAAIATGCASAPLFESESDAMSEQKSGPASKSVPIPVSGTESIAAGDVQLKSGSLTLNGNLQVAEEAQPGQIILMVHGTLAHNGMEIMQAFQERFSDLGLSSLAITLSLGIDDRRGMFGCDQPHKHRHTDSLGEIDAWFGWLTDQGYSRISLLGHSRGGNQVALYARAQLAHSPDALILIAPMTFSSASLDFDYLRNHGQSLSELVAEARSEAALPARDSLMRVPAFLHCADTQVSPESFLSYYAPEYEADTPTVLQNLELPVLVIAGTEDAISPELKDRVPQSRNIHLIEIDGADHFFRDLYADDGAEAIASFLSKLSDAQTTQ